MSKKKSSNGFMKERLHEQFLGKIDPGGKEGYKEIDLELSNKPLEGATVASGEKYRSLEFTRVMKEGVKINGVEFFPSPEIGFKSDVVRKPVVYKYDYLRVAQLVASGEWSEVDTYRQLISNDLWFVTYFVLKPFSDAAGMAKANHPFTVKICQEVEEGPQDFTLDIWARFHFKSSIITIAETIMYQLKNPNHSTGIFSHKSPVAKDFIFSIKSIFENERILPVCFPDVAWREPKREAPLWSLDEGIILKRDTSRKEASVSGHGLTEGMPTGLHFERRVYDDITTADIVSSMEVVEKVKHAFDTSQNLKTLVGSHHRVVGTYYSHVDPLIFVRDKKDLDGNPKYFLRFKPATSDGTANGTPVLMTQKSLDELKGDSSFNCQQLLDPTPSSEQRLNPGFLQKIEPSLIPKNCRQIVTIDQAGDMGSNISKNTDAWAVGVFAVEPFSDEIGQSKVFIKDLWCEVCGESEAIDRIVQMYINAGIVSCIGVEKVSQTTTHIHVANALRARGRHVEFSDDKRSTGVLLRPAGRNKKKFIESATAWPLNNSKWFYSSQIPARYIDRLFQEMTNFPLWHDDILNAMAYLYDILRDFHFPHLDQDSEHIKMLKSLEENRSNDYDVLTFGLKANRF